MLFRHNYRNSNNHQTQNKWLDWGKVKEHCRSLYTRVYFCEETHRCGPNKATWKVQQQIRKTDLWWLDTMNPFFFFFPLQDSLLSITFNKVLLQIPSPPAFVLTLTDVKQSHNIIVRWEILPSFPDWGPRRVADTASIGLLWSSGFWGISSWVQQEHLKWDLESLIWAIFCWK